MFHRTLGFIVVFFVVPASLLAIDIDGEVRVGSSRHLARPATVQLLRARQVVYEQFTDLDGRFEFHGVEATPYVVRAKYEDMPEAEVAVDVLGGAARYRVPITIQPPKEPHVGKTEAVSVDQLLIPARAKKEYEAGLKSRKAAACDKAIPHLQNAIRLAPQYGEAYNELGICLQGQRDVVGAE